MRPIWEHDSDFMTQEGAHTCPVLLSGDSTCGQTGATSRERREQTTCVISCRVGFNKYIGLSRLILLCDSGPNTISLQKVVFCKVVLESTSCFRDHPRVITGQWSGEDCRAW